MSRSLLVLCLAFAVAGCSAFGGSLSQTGSDFGDVADDANPAGQEGRREFDSDLCWQSVGGKNAEGVEDAYAACMRDKGWSDAQ